MTDTYWCPECKVHRTSSPERKCPCCAPVTPKFPGPPSRDRPISTTSGDL